MATQTLTACPQNSYVTKPITWSQTYSSQVFVKNPRHELHYGGCAASSVVHALVQVSLLLMAALF
jgi:hypothetical protein